MKQMHKQTQLRGLHVRFNLLITSILFEKKSPSNELSKYLKSVPFNAIVRVFYYGDIWKFSEKNEEI